MKKLIVKMRKLKLTPWAKLTRGEKVAKVIITLLKISAIVAIGLALAGVVLAVIAGIAVAFGIASAIAGGFNDASRAYRYGDRRYKWFWFW